MQQCPCNKIAKNTLREIAVVVATIFLASMTSFRKLDNHVDYSMT